MEFEQKRYAYLYLCTNKSYDRSISLLIVLICLLQIMIIQFLNIDMDLLRLTIVDWLITHQTLQLTLTLISNNSKYLTLAIQLNLNH